eukprot:751004-Hanusia_phi.AAC.9
MGQSTWRLPWGGWRMLKHCLFVSVGSSAHYPIAQHRPSKLPTARFTRTKMAILTHEDLNGYGEQAPSQHPGLRLIATCHSDPHRVAEHSKPHRVRPLAAMRISYSAGWRGFGIKSPLQCNGDPSGRRTAA